jgi:hypothetical protein
MDEHNLDTPAAASSTSSPLSSAPPSDDESTQRLARPEKRVAKGYWWKEEEIKVYDELVARYEEGSVDWQEVARELARRCPMDPAPARTAAQCATRLHNLSESSVLSL